MVLVVGADVELDPIDPAREVALRGRVAVADVAISVMLPIPTEWWLRPANSAAGVGEHSAAGWKHVYLRSWAARRSAVGVWHGPPKALDAPKPTSSTSR